MTVIVNKINYKNQLKKNIKKYSQINKQKKHKLHKQSSIQETLNLLKFVCKSINTNNKKPNKSPVTCCLSPVICRLSPVNCQLSPITCHLSPGICHLSPVTCQLSPVTCTSQHATCPSLDSKFCMLHLQKMRVED